MYRALTSGAGHQTLGEEYCDIIQCARESSTISSKSSIGDNSSENKSRNHEHKIRQPSDVEMFIPVPNLTKRVASILLHGLGPVIVQRLLTMDTSSRNSNSENDIDEVRNTSCLLYTSDAADE